MHVALAGCRDAWCNRIMVTTADTLPDDPGTFKAMLLAERARATRLEQSSRSCSVIASAAGPRRCRRTNCCSAWRRSSRSRRAVTPRPMQPMRPSDRAEPHGVAGTEERCRRIAGRDADRPRRSRLPVLSAGAAPDRRGCERTTGYRPGPVPGPSRKAAEVCLPGLRDMVQAPASARLIEGGLPTEATVAQVLVAKYADHLPLYRQAQIYARQGLDLDRSTLADWVGRAAFLLRPVHERLLARLKQSPKLFADETTAPVLDPGRGRTKTGQLWAYARDDRPWGGTDPPAVAYVYAPDRKANGRSFTSRALPAYSRSTAMPAIESWPSTVTLNWRSAGPMCAGASTNSPQPVPHRSPARRSNVSPGSTSSKPRSAAAPRRTSRRPPREERPLVDEFEPWLRAKLGLISQKTKLAEAIRYRYALSRWNGLTRFIADGGIEIDSNVVERAIRPIALNRKNALFAGSDGDGEHWAVVASLIETCKLIGAEPHAYLDNVSTRIVNGHPNSQIDELLPWAYLDTQERWRVA